MISREALFFAVVTALGCSLLPAMASAQSLAGKEAQASALTAKIHSQGEQLSIADEALNRAAFERQQIDHDAAAAKAQVAALSKRYEVYRDRLSARARMLYMHPGAAIDSFLGVRSLAELGRARVLGDRVLTADAGFVKQTDEMRRKIISRTNRLEQLRASARSKEQELAGRRAAVANDFATQRSLLASVKGDIAKIIEAQRMQQLAAAPQASLQSRVQGPSGPLAPSANTSRIGSPSSALAPPPPVDPGAGKALAVARAQIGKPYVWAAAGPDTFDCSGLTMYAWGSVGISMVHFAAAQYNAFPHVLQSELQPGDLVFFGSPIHHEGIYEGGGVMINAPETGELVRRDSIYRRDYVGASRPTRR